MRQRIVGAIGISCEPRLLIADKPTTSLPKRTAGACLQGTRPYHVDDLVLGRHIGFFGGLGGSGFQPAMTRAQYRALALSVMPGNMRRSSTAAENSPP